MSDHQDGITTISLSEAHSQWNAVVDLEFSQTLALCTQPQEEPLEFVLHVVARHHRPEDGKIRLGIVANRKRLVAMAHEILDAFDQE